MKKKIPLILIAISLCVSAGAWIVYAKKCSLEKTGTVSECCHPSAVK